LIKNREIINKLKLNYDSTSVSITKDSTHIAVGGKVIFSKKTITYLE
jgi:hypothetical protein